jgi:hypothetical protein
MLVSVAGVGRPKAELVLTDEEWEHWRSATVTEERK